MRAPRSAQPASAANAAEPAAGGAGAAAGPGNVGAGGSEAAAEGVGAREETERLKGPAASRRSTARSQASDDRRLRSPIISPFHSGSGVGLRRSLVAAWSNPLRWIDRPRLGDQAEYRTAGRIANQLRFIAGATFPFRQHCNEPRCPCPKTECRGFLCARIAKNAEAHLAQADILGLSGRDVPFWT